MTKTSKFCNHSRVFLVLTNALDEPLKHLLCYIIWFNCSSFPMLYLLFELFGGHHIPFSLLVVAMSV
jgi:hypothetical protein